MEGVGRRVSKFEILLLLNMKDGREELELIIVGLLFREEYCKQDCQYLLKNKKSNGSGKNG